MRFIKLIILLIFLIILGFIVNKIFFSRKNTNLQTHQIAVTPSQITGNIQIKFQGSRYEQYAYKIGPGVLSESAKEALAGFTIRSKELPDRTTQVILQAQKKEYHTQTYLLKQGYSLYFIEESKNDDDPSSHTDATLEDDTAVLVDPQGFIAIQ